MYAKIDSGAISKYPYAHADLRNDHPLTSFPSDAMSRADCQSEFSFEPVVEVAAPTRAGWRAVQGTPTKVGGKWTQNWSLVVKDVSELSPDEITETEAPVVENHTASPGPPVLDGEVWKRSWVQTEDDWFMKRKKAYGHFDSQIEYIAENGLAAWQTKLAEIKALYPKGEKSIHDNR